ncbi:SRPBCC family protein [Streptomyces sp. RY43-2]|uniref:SRPBCC family protein n=1 Tax=Streptomyces macrolidinus TaxID=2952607 RepID=A0ABT0Z8T8_9ACTN|nr:SRPBCC family protein [Streptomyces macrolidinus]MCN9240170.1 SRPBCC family protein [Streptomyces macrolidinus]
MSTLEEHVDINVPIDTAWDSLHQVENYPRFMQGVREARTETGGRAHLDVETGGPTRELEAEVSDRDRDRVMTWQTKGTPHLEGTLSFQSIDRNNTRVQARVEYEPDAVRESFGGPKGFAQANAIERVVRGDLEQFKDYVERER